MDEQKTELAEYAAERDARRGDTRTGSSRALRAAAGSGFETRGPEWEAKMALLFEPGRDPATE